MIDLPAPLAPQLIVIEATGRYHRRPAADLLATPASGSRS
jgi:transposase